ncbi:DNA-binding PucR family transcriptional regulator [Marmoricola sp. OAE513]|uniref:PucR family transcriptional regulator n=1 Tax=Marmoricola sp. OAE513 TaxID=2817894 RepID=UPI001DCA7E8A
MPLTEDDFNRRTTERVSATAERMSQNLTGLTHDLFGVLSASITELQGDHVILDLLRASIEGNLETISLVVRYDLPASEIQAPPAAVEYARRLAQRGISSSALLRAYRLGQENALAWSLARIADEESDPMVAYTAGQAFTAITFRYIDAVSEQVLVVYEAERERWLANRNTVRAVVLTDLLDSGVADVAQAETALGYRLRQHHLGVVLWRPHDVAPGGELRDLERLLGRLARAVGSSAQPLFAAQDRAMAWGWIPLGARNEVPSPEDLDVAEDDGVLIAVGTPASGPDGFRRTHLDALRAQSVAMVAQEQAQPVTSYGDPSVRAAALLAGDLDGTRRLVADALGDLAEDSESAERLRETVRVFLSTRNSFAATAQLVHLHKNTVKYRVDRAVEARGRGLDEDRLELELALIACRWLGTAALVPAHSPVAGIGAPPT